MQYQSNFQLLVPNKAGRSDEFLGFARSPFLGPIGNKTKISIFVIFRKNFIYDFPGNHILIINVIFIRRVFLKSNHNKILHCRS